MAGHLQCSYNKEYYPMDFNCLNLQGGYCALTSRRCGLKPAFSSLSAPQVNYSHAPGYLQERYDFDAPPVSSNIPGDVADGTDYCHIVGILFTRFNSQRSVAGGVCRNFSSSGDRCIITGLGCQLRHIFDVSLSAYQRLQKVFSAPDTRTLKQRIQDYQRWAGTNTGGVYCPSVHEALEDAANRSACTSTKSQSDFNRVYQAEFRRLSSLYGR